MIIILSESFNNERKRYWDKKILNSHLLTNNEIIVKFLFPMKKNFFKIFFNNLVLFSYLTIINYMSKSFIFHKFHQKHFKLKSVFSPYYCIVISFICIDKLKMIPILFVNFYGKLNISNTCILRISTCILSKHCKTFAKRNKDSAFQSELLYK